MIEASYSLTEAGLGHRKPLGGIDHFVAEGREREASYSGEHLVAGHNRRHLQWRLALLLFDDDGPALPAPVGIV